MNIVSNTSPLIALSSIGELRLLRELFETVHLPGAVVREIVDQGAGRQATQEVQMEISQRHWLFPETVDPTPLLVLLKVRLDPGEAEAITLAHMRKIPLLVDDREARGVASAMGLQFFGSLGVLKKAKMRGIIVAGKPLVTRMREAGIYYADDLITKFLADLDES